MRRVFPELMHPGRISSETDNAKRHRLLNLVLPRRY
jgi:hypothetical protein